MHNQTPLYSCRTDPDQVADLRVNSVSNRFSVRTHQAVRFGVRRRRCSARRIAYYLMPDRSPFSGKRIACVVIDDELHRNRRESGRIALRLMADRRVEHVTRILCELQRLAGGLYSNSFQDIMFGICEPDKGKRITRRRWGLISSFRVL